MCPEGSVFAHIDIVPTDGTLRRAIHSLKHAIGKVIRKLILLFNIFA